MKRATVAMFFAFAVLGAMLSPHPGFAQGAEDDVSAAGLAVSPAIFEVVAEPGKSVKKEFLIQNISGSPMPVSAALERLRPHEQEINLSASESFNAAEWVEIDEPHNILGVKERRRLTATIAVPKNAEPGGHYATIMLQPLAAVTSTSESTAKIAPRVGLLVFITVPGEALYEVKLRNNVGRLQLSSDIALRPTFANTGTIHILPTANVVVRDALGNTKVELPLKPSVVLPNTVKEYSTNWNKPALMGVYSVETVATYGSGQTPLTSGRQYFVVVRILPLIFLLATVVPLSVFVFKTYRRWPEAWRAFKK